MLVKRKKTQDNIPTLSELVDEEVASDGAEPVASESTHERPAGAATAAESSESQARMRSPFEISIEAMVAEILNRHMANARDEITRSVLTEVRARLTGGSRDKKGEIE